MTFHRAEEVECLLERVTVGVHGGSDDLGALLVHSEHTVNLIGGGVGVVGLGAIDVEAHVAFEVCGIDGFDEILVGLHLLIAFVFLDLLGIFDLRSCEEEPFATTRREDKIGSAFGHVVAVHEEDVVGDIGYTLSLSFGVGVKKRALNCAEVGTAENVVVYIYGFETCHETEANAHALLHLGAAPGEKDGVVVEIKGAEVLVGTHATHSTSGHTVCNEDVVVEVEVSGNTTHLNCKVIAVDEGTVADDKIALDFTSEQLSADRGATDLCTSGVLALDEHTSCLTAFGGASAAVLGIISAISVVEALVESDAVDNQGLSSLATDIDFEAGVASTCSALLFGWADGSDVFSRVALCESGVPAAFERDVFLDFHEALVELAEVVALGDSDCRVLSGQVDSLLEVLYRFVGCGAVVAVGAGRGIYVDDGAGGLRGWGRVCVFGLVLVVGRIAHGIACLDRCKQKRNSGHCVNEKLCFHKGFLLKVVVSIITIRACQENLRRDAGSHTRPVGRDGIDIDQK